MNDTVSGTTTPYSNTNTGSVSQPSSYNHGYNPPQTKTRDSSESPNFNFVEVIKIGASAIVGAAITYVTMVSALQGDIAENKNNISVVHERLSNVAEKVNNAETDLKKISEIEKNVAVINVKIEHMGKKK